MSRYALYDIEVKTITPTSAITPVPYTITMFEDTFYDAGVISDEENGINLYTAGLLADKSKTVYVLVRADTSLNNVWVTFRFNDTDIPTSRWAGGNAFPVRTSADDRPVLVKIISWGNTVNDLALSYIYIGST